MKEMEKTMNLTNSILEIANVLMSKYSADIRIEMRRSVGLDQVHYIITVAPWNSNLRTSIDVLDFDIQNIDVPDLISLYLEHEMKKLEAK